MEKNSKGLAFFVVVFIVLCCIISCCVLAATMLFNSDFDSDINFSVGDNSEYSNYDKAEITLDRQACFGFCPDYTVTITEAGEVIFEGRNFVQSPGKNESYSIPEANVTKIIREFEDVDFFDLDDEYVDPYITDLPSTTISLRLDDEFKSIKLYGLEDTVPQELVDLADKIDELANTDKYVGEPNTLYDED